MDRLAAPAQVAFPEGGTPQGPELADVAAVGQLAQRHAQQGRSAPGGTRDIHDIDVAHDDRLRGRDVVAFEGSPVPTGE